MAKSIEQVNNAFIQAKQWAKEYREKKKQPESGTTLIMVSYCVVVVAFLWTILDCWSTTSPNESNNESNLNQQQLLPQLSQIPMQQMPLPTIPISHQPSILPINQNNVTLVDAATGQVLQPNQIQGNVQFIDVQQ